MLFFYIVIYLIVSLLCIWILFYNKLLKSLMIKFKMQKKVLEIDYYREELEEYSPLIYAKLMGKDIFDNDSISAMILYLKEKKCISDDGFVISNNLDNLESHERFFVENNKFLFYDLLNRKNTKYSRDYSIKEYLNYLVNKDLIKFKLLKEFYNSYIDLIPFFYIMISCLFICKIDNLLANNSVAYNNIIVQIIFLTYIITTFLWVTIFLLHSKFNLSFKSKETLKGYEYTAKLYAQKKFLEEFSVISSKSLKEQSLLGNYIYMAVLYGLKGQLDKESKEFYIDILNKVSYKDSYNNIKNNLFLIFSFAICYLPWLVLTFYTLSDSLMSILFINFVIMPFIYFYLLKMEEQWKK